jgi:hypothetical protein
VRIGSAHRARGLDALPQAAKEEKKGAQKGVSPSREQFRVLELMVRKRARLYSDLHWSDRLGRLVGDYLFEPGARCVMGQTLRVMYWSGWLKRGPGEEWLVTRAGRKALAAAAGKKKK